MSERARADLIHLLSLALVKLVDEDREARRDREALVVPAEPTTDAAEAA